MRCPPPLRDWEWRYVQRLCHQELNVLAIGSDSVHDIACPPSGELLICEDGSVSLRSIPDGSEKSRWPLPLGETPRQRITISENGKFLVSTVGKNFAPRTAVTEPARIFESRSGKLVFEIADVGIVRELDMSPTSTHAISRGDDRKLRIWDIRSKALVKEIPIQTVTNVSFSPDGKSFAVGSAKKSIDIFNTETGELLRRIPEPNLLRSGVVTVSHSLRYSPDGRSIAVCLDGGGIHIYDSTTGTSIRNWKTPLRQVIDCAYSPDGLWLALMDDADRTIQIWNVDTGERINRISLRSLIPKKLQFSSDGMILVGFTGAATVSFWDLSAAHVGSQLGKIPRNDSYPGQQYAPCHVRVSPSGNLAALYSGHRIDLYDPKDHRFRRTLVAPSSDQVTRGIVFDEAKGVLYQLTHGAILSWDLEKGSVVQTLPISASFSSFDKGFFPEEYSDRGFATYSPQLPFLGNNGQYLWVDSTRTSQKGEGERYLFTSTWLTGERSEVPFFAPFKGRVYALASSDDGQRMFAALNVDKELICLNAESGRKSWSVATPHRILSMKFTSRGDRLGLPTLAAI